ncbi:type II secretion system F family protein [Arthrobacter sp. PAMC25564]|uniref:type II secretion system F family protein n=1 Tax=Arthrobacter sp. PAMC25564 TaxID=2565366 RepID=UPI0010A26E4B|nr:type II secretion system F family protein [Arthrobacter sp. PAMC25564]QCB96749.1 type II secretion system F family protein [Arthrobacter sp. PAMC25564]
MSVVAWLMVGLIVVPISAMVWSFISIDRGGLAAVRNNLGRGFRVVKESAPAAQPRGPANLGIRLTPKGYAGWLDKLLARAGRPASMPLERLLIAKPALALVAAFFSIFLATKSPTGILLLLTVLLPVLAYFVPDILIHGRGAERQKAIELELPNTLDQMLISVEAGLGFEMAMARAGQNGKGPLAEELLRTLQDMQVGRSRKDAYLAMAERTGAPDLRSFVRSVVQADSYGIALANVLRTQAKQMRVKRRQRAEEKAMKLPVKVLFPLMFCILPVLFIVIIGPAVIKVMQNMMGAY